MKKNYLLIFLLIALIYSCKDEIIVQNDLPTESASEVEFQVPIVKTSFEYTTVDYSHFSSQSTSYGYSQNLLTLKIELAKPEVRSNINKLVIKLNDSWGWEFYSEQLNDMYSEADSTYVISNLAIPSTSSYPIDLFFNLEFYNNNNAKSVGYECIAKRLFLSSVSYDYAWLASNKIEILLTSGLESLITKYNPMIYYLDEDMVVIDSTIISTSDISDEDKILINNVPDKAEYFYLGFENNATPKLNLKAQLKTLRNRLLEGTVFFEDDFTFTKAKYIKNEKKVVGINNNNDELILVDINNLEVKKKALFFRPIVFDYSDYNNNLYVGYNNGELYEYNIAGEKIKKIFSINSNYGSGIKALTLSDSLLFVASDYDSLHVYSIKSYSRLLNRRHYNIGSTSSLFYNDKYSQLYFDGYSTFTRLKFDDQLNDFDPDESVTKNYNSSYGRFHLQFNSQDKFLTTSGYVIACDSSKGNDLNVVASVGASINSAVISQDDAYLFILSNASDYYSTYTFKIMAYDLSTYEIINVVKDIPGTSSFAFEKDGKLGVIASINNKECLYNLEINKILSGSLTKRTAVTNYRYPQKIN